MTSKTLFILLCILLSVVSVTADKAWAVKPTPTAPIVIVHGSVSNIGDITNGSGFSISPHSAVGQYLIQFTKPFATRPDCVVTSVGGYPTTWCYPIEVTTDVLNIYCEKGYIYNPDSANETLDVQVDDAAITFICVQ